MRGPCTLAVVAALALLAAPACNPTPDKIARWKETERGPAKLREALQNSGLDPSLRAQALAALVEIGMAQDALADLGKVDDKDRKAIIHDAVPRLAEVARGSGVAGSATTRAQREAKDALFLVRSDAADADRALADSALIEWTTADLTGRMSSGGHSSEKILVAIGPKTAPRLAELMQPGSSQLVSAAAIFGKVADTDARARAADGLIQRIQKAGPRGLDDQAMQALGLIGGPRATAFLVDQAEHGREETREKALLALAQGNVAQGDSALQSAALRIAGDKKAPGKVRESAFQLLEKMPTSVGGLVALMHDPDETVRWRAVEAALASGKDKAVVPVLEALNPAGKYKQEDLDSYVVHDLLLVGPTALPPLQTELASKNAVARKVAETAIAQLQKHR
ncbi:MAG: HEAT repeat domain-containing protein [Polyangia bacterium]